MDDIFYTIENNSEGFFKDRGSKFYAFAFSVENETEVDQYRAMLKKKYYDARHHVYAFHLGTEQPTFRASDDGEPSNSSGPPVLGQIRSHNLTNILIVVVRYFGGTKLGVSGLINAYKTAANDAIANATIVEKFLETKITIQFEYANINDAMRLTKQDGIRIINQDFGANSCLISFMVRNSVYDKVQSELSKHYNITIL